VRLVFARAPPIENLASARDILMTLEDAGSWRKIAIHSLTLVLANKRRKLVRTPDYINYGLASICTLLPKTIEGDLAQLLAD